MAGGQGTRFWPWSTEGCPKQFLNVVGDSPLISQTFDRLKALFPPEDIFVVADAKYEKLTRECLPLLGRDNYICEPCPRNTAPCLILSNITLSSADPEASVLVVPADHYIPDNDLFSQQFDDALSLTDRPLIVTAGIPPDSPHTGYGYINVDREDSSQVGDTRFYAVSAFKEKPGRQLAQEYMDAGTYFWNSGMFVYNLTHFKSFLETYAPYYYEQYLKLSASRHNQHEFERIFSRITPESIDFALMEKIKEVKMLEAEFTWNDVGSWSSVFDALAKDSGNNANPGGQVLINTKDSLVFSTQDKPIAVIGLEGVTVVHTENGILVADLDNLQQIKEVTKLLKGEH